MELLRLLTIAFVVTEIVAFGFLIGLQSKNWKGANNALATILKILELPKYNPENVIDSGIRLSQFEREIELPLDEIRSFSNAALVTGIGGTMALFFLETIPIGSYVWTTADSGNIQLPPWPSIFLGLILALLSSLIGVIIHLRIALKVLATAYKKVSHQEVKFLDAQTLAQEKAPETELSKQLQELTEAWNNADAVDLIEMIPQFLEGQTKVMQKMHDGSEEQRYTTLAALQSQKAFIEKIDGLLTGLNEEQRAQRETVTIIQECQHNQLEAVSAYLERLVYERESLTREIERLPENIKNSLDVKTINEIFGKQAQTYVASVGLLFENTIKDLESNLDKHLIRLNTNLAGENVKIERFFNDLQSQIVNEVVHPLRKVANQLSEVTGKMPKFGDDLLQSVEAISGIPEKLEEVGKDINDVVSSTATEVFAPVSEDMKRYIYTVSETHKRLEKIIRGLVKLIRDMIKEIEGSKS